MLSYLFELLLVLTTSLDGWLAGWVALEEWKLRLTSAKVELKLRLSLAKWDVEEKFCKVEWTACRDTPNKIKTFQLFRCITFR